MVSLTAQQFSGQGRLEISVFTVDVGRPADNAVIQVMPGGMETQPLEELITDSSGHASTISLPAPPLEYSMRSESSRPYSIYDIRITMEGYIPQIVKGVQIFPNTTAYQDIRLHPAHDTMQPETILIKEHSLWGIYPPKLPETEVKELSPATGYVVLPDPVVPEFIIVHDGSPKDAFAPNYWVPFSDYIKNVACCEIFSNWPHATIMANVLAIISFTLNRVYTEWYRGKGYNFTITSSTAYDHAFSYGRNFFGEIASVVDTIFTTFITKPGIRQPLLAQYCDGKKVSCPKWMTQWGSKALGDQGYLAIDILKSFYGHDIYLMQAKKVAGVPRSYSGNILQIGATGEHVRVIQDQLNAIANNFPAIKKIRVDGIYGEETRKAVETFQTIFRLSADGIIGFSTWYRISDIYTAVKRIAELG